jgi:hypothetical protein
VTAFASVVCWSWACWLCRRAAERRAIGRNSAVRGVTATLATVDFPRRGNNCTASNRAELRASTLPTANSLSGEANFHRHGAANLTPSLALRVSSMGRMAWVAAEGRAATPQQHFHRGVAELRRACEAWASVADAEG